jgi:hypothetical protein
MVLPACPHFTWCCKHYIEHATHTPFTVSLAISASGEVHRWSSVEVVGIEAKERELQECGLDAWLELATLLPTFPRCGIHDTN